jgi:putative PIN family toxin of toxin-antitoxin system
MEVVLDTNVFISGMFFARPPYRILQAWRDGRVQLVVCLGILAEYRAVAARLNRKYRNVDVLSLVDLVAVRSRIVQARTLLKPVCEDPNDDVFLACALTAKTPLIVSGDRHLLKASGFAGLQILRPKTFVDTYL